MTGAATLAGALALSLSLAALFAARIATVLRICAVQGLAVALAAGAQGWDRHVASLYLMALLTVALNGLALPLALRRMVAQATMPAIGRCGVIGSAAAAFALVTASVATLTAQGVALGFSVLLLGLLPLVFRSHPLLPGIGLLSSQNGLVLAACAIPGLPPSILLVTALPLVPSLCIASVWLFDRNQTDLTAP